MGNNVVPGRSEIELRVPTSLRFASVVRVVAASLGADEGFSITGLAELRTAVQEAFEAALEETVPDDRSDADTSVDVRFSVSPGRVQIEFAVASATPPYRVSASRMPGTEQPDDGLVIENGRGTVTTSLRRRISESEG
jgi:anti-sigma regulatory factor (Ser/Thr protein kinase)